VGCGIAGASAAWQLSRAGYRTLTIEQFQLNHTRGSSHGESRLFRTSYFEGETYVPLSIKAQGFWKELAETTGMKLILYTGGLYIGRREGSLIQGALRSAIRHGLPFELLSSREAGDRYPQFAIGPSEEAFFEPHAGIILVEESLRALVSESERHGAEFAFGKSVSTWKSDGKTASVIVDGEEYSSRSLVLTAGPWIPTLVPELRERLQLERQVLFWFSPKVLGNGHSSAAMPVFIWQTSAPRAFYGVPDMGHGVKIATENGMPVSSASESWSPPCRADQEKIRPFVKEKFPLLDDNPRDAITCVYTNAPDHRFVVGRHPRFPNVVISSACSGHGFKFGPAIGELVLSSIEQGAPTRGYLSIFDPTRLM
jgi:sarcosine oxidase